MYLLTVSQYGIEGRFSTLDLCRIKQLNNECLKNKNMWEESIRILRPFEVYTEEISPHTVWIPFFHVTQVTS